MDSVKCDSLPTERVTALEALRVQVQFWGRCAARSLEKKDAAFLSTVPHTLTSNRT